MRKKHSGSFRLMSKKESKKMWGKVDDPNNIYFQDYTDYYFKKTSNHGVSK